MRLKEILQHGDEHFCVCEAFIFIWGIGFLFNGDIRMGFQKIFILESNVPDNAKAVCKDAEFIGIAEMPVDIHLLYGRVCIRVGRHGAASMPEVSNKSMDAFAASICWQIGCVISTRR